MIPPCHQPEAVAAAVGPVGHHVMPGLPVWALVATVAGAAMLSLWGLYGGHAWFVGERRRRFELTGIPFVRWLLARRWLQFSVQAPLVLLLGLVLYAGFYGTPVADENLSTVLTWSIWWTLLILDVVLLGRMWCMACPWEAIAAWTRRLALWRRRDEPLALNLPWPKWLRNVYPATILFLGLTWLELGYGVTMSPRATASLGLLMIVMAVVPALFFEKRSFCRYGCLVGRIVGLYSMIAPVEVRARDASVCRSCKTKDCMTGNDRGYPCPTGQCLTSMKTNTYCTVCTECFKSCPSDNVALNLRPPAADLHDTRRPRRDEAVLALVLVAMSSFHGFTMTPTWNDLLSAFIVGSDISRLVAFSVMMAGVLVLPVLVYLALMKLAARWGAANRRLLMRPRGMWPVAARYAYPLIAVALMYHLAHNVGHLLMEGSMIVPVISDPLGNGMDLLGTASFQPRMLTTMPVVWGLMIGCVLVGHWWAVRAMERAHRQLARDGGATRLPLRARAIAALFPLVITAVNLWLLAQPMEMRTGM